MSIQNPFDLIPPRIGSFITVVDTAYLYPFADIQRAFASTTHSYTFDGFHIICPTLADIYGLYYDIYAQTATSQPVGNVGYSLGVGSQLDDLGKEIVWQLTTGQVIIRWRLVRQITPQSPATVIPTPGDSPNGTIGYIPTFVSLGGDAYAASGNTIDPVRIVRTG